MANIPRTWPPPKNHNLVRNKTYNLNQRILKDEGRRSNREHSPRRSDGRGCTRASTCQWKSAQLWARRVRGWTKSASGPFVQSQRYADPAYGDSLPWGMLLLFAQAPEVEEDWWTGNRPEQRWNAGPLITYALRSPLGSWSLRYLSRPVCEVPELAREIYNPFIHSELHTYMHTYIQVKPYSYIYLSHSPQVTISYP